MSTEAEGGALVSAPASDIETMGNSLDNMLAVDDKEHWSPNSPDNHNTNSLDMEANQSTSMDNSAVVIASTTATSSTAYSFTGSALPGGSTSDLNQKKNLFEASGGNDSADGDKSEDSIFECNICLDTAKDAVVSMCGHLYCWPCLHQWLETRPHRKLCPVCKAAISKDKVIPLYGRNSTKQEDPRYFVLL